MNQPMLYCSECEGRVCSVKTNVKYKQAPQTCPWSNTVGDFVYASWAPRPGPADIPKTKEDK